MSAPEPLVFLERSVRFEVADGELAIVLDSRVVSPFVSESARSGGFKRDHARKLIAWLQEAERWLSP